MSQRHWQGPPDVLILILSNRETDHQNSIENFYIFILDCFLQTGTFIIFRCFYLIGHHMLETALVLNRYMNGSVTAGVRRRIKYGQR